MAKVTGPLLSIDASGSVAETMTFSKWVGRNYVRQRVIPANPQSAAQMLVRNIFQAMGKATKWAGLTAETADPPDELDKDAIEALAPADQRWNGFEVSTMATTSGAGFIAGNAAFDALDGAEQTAWDDAADAATPPVQEAPQTDAGGAAGTALSNGNVLFLHRYAMWLMGAIPDEPDATPPTYS
jgi:hypothetical protein